MSNATKAITKKASKVGPSTSENSLSLDNDEKLFYEKFKNGELISPKLLGMYEKSTITFTQKLFTEKPNLSKKEAALEILQNMPDNIPSDAFAKLLGAGMKAWMSLKDPK